MSNRCDDCDKVSELAQAEKEIEGLIESRDQMNRRGEELKNELADSKDRINQLEEALDDIQEAIRRAK